MKAVDLPGHSARGGIGRIHGIFYCGAQGKQEVSAAAAFHGDGSSAVSALFFVRHGPGTGRGTGEKPLSAIFDHRAVKGSLF